MGKKDSATKSTEETEEGSVYDSILSTCCCAGPPPDKNSIANKKCDPKQRQPRQPDPARPRQETEELELDETPKFWERLSDAALFLVGLAPPVKIVRCASSSSVDGSVLTLPRVLTMLADDYDEENKNCQADSISSETKDWPKFQIWGVKEDRTFATGDVPAHTADGDLHRSEARRRRRKNRVGNRLKKIKSISSQRRRYNEDTDAPGGMQSAPVKIEKEKGRSRPIRSSGRPTSVQSRRSARSKKMEV